MNWNHLKAMLWMRWRIMVNRVKRGGKVGNVFLAILLACALLASAALFCIALVVGVDQMPDAKPFELMMVWTALAAAFVLMWLIGLLMDLQRSDSMSFKNLLHLPVSLGWVFLYNYVGSFVSISIAIFMPAMLGLCLAMVIVHGAPMLISFPLVFGFFWMITALTYHLRGWLSHLMEDKRRGRNIVAAITFSLVLVLQLPNLFNMYYAGQRTDARQERAEAEQLYEELHPDLTAAEHSAHSKEVLNKRIDEKKEMKRQIDENVSMAAMWVPLGWLPLGVRTAFDGRLLYSILCASGMFLVGAASLRRSFAATLAGFLGAEKPVKQKTGAEPKPDAPTGKVKRGTLLIQRTFPFAGEEASGIAAASLRSLLRAPEGKMMMLGPVILLVVFGGMLFTLDINESFLEIAPAATLGATMIGMLSLMQVMQNQFGIDRQGFRAFVLSPVPRRLILRGKNAGLAPIAIVFGLVALVGLQLFVGLGFFHFVGACFQLLSTYLILCMIGNTVSILLPMRLKAHAMKADKVKFSTIMWQMLSMMFIPVAISPLLIPYGVESIFGWLHWPGGVALYVVLHAALLGGIYLLYTWALKRQGAMLQDREQAILETLTHE